MKKKLVKFLLIIISITVVSCKKYDEGPAISFRSAKARVEGDWTLVSGTIDGVNVFNKQTLTGSTYSLTCGTVNYTEESKLKKWRWIFLDNGKFKGEETYFEKNFSYLNGCTPMYNEEESFWQYEGEWKLEDNNKKLVINADGETIKFNIIELRNKSIHLKGTFDGSNYDLKFEQ